MGQKVLIRFQ